MKLTAHQKRILAAMLALETRHKRAWWPREAIGHVVAAGGYHQVIQKRSMLALSGLGLVLLEVESWPREVRQLVHCDCAAYCWGLTDGGRDRATSLVFDIRWPDKAQKAIATATLWLRHRDEPCEGRTTGGDRWQPRRVHELLDDEDDDDPADHWKR
jgi:hypothetical protein